MVEVENRYALGTCIKPHPVPLAVKEYFKKLEMQMLEKNASKKAILPSLLMLQGKVGKVHSNVRQSIANENNCLGKEINQVICTLKGVMT